MAWVDATLWSGYVVFLRVGAAMSLIPGFGEQTVPVRVKLIMAIAATMVIAPSVDTIEVASVSDMMRYAVTEPAIGLMIGLGLRLFLMAVQTAGSIAAQSTSLAQMSAGAFPDPMPAIGQVLTMAAVALFFVLDLHIEAILLIQASYLMFPAGGMPDAAATAEWGITTINHTFQLAFRLAAPFFLISLIYNVTLGAINKAMPQLMVIFVGAPLITWGSLVVLMLVAPLLLHVWVTHLTGFMANPFGGTP
ncbi:MAG: flagellar biosynthetic protein FliR [Primorskyibacter sp.]